VFANFLRVWQAALAVAPDWIVITGDVSDRGGRGSYELLHSVIDRAPVPVFVMYGNHDRGQCWQLPPVLWLGGWRLLCLNSTPGVVPLTEVRSLLQSHPGAPTLLALHHHPMAIAEPGLLWLNQLRLENGTELMALAAEFPQVRGLVFGHTHRRFDACLGHYQLLGTPAAGLPEWQGRCGFRVLDLGADGTLQTEVLGV
jgi:Icc protein